MAREQRKLAAILAADVAGYSRLTGADEEGTLKRLRALRAELIDPAIAGHGGRIVKTAGDGLLVEFASVVDAARCAIAVQRAMAIRNAEIEPERQIQFRVGIHLGDVVVEADGDLMGDGVNIAARLEGISEPGGICLSNAAYEQVRDKIDAAFADLGEKELKNIARPVRVYSIVAAEAPHRATLRVASPPPAGGGRLGGGLAAEQSPPRLSIVVLPFANIGGDPEQDYFVDGVTESLTTDLSRISGSFVIARNTAFTYKGKRIDVKQIGRELNVRYVLEGSVQRGGNRLRVNVQLIDAETGAHLWAERFDKPLADLFDMQDEIVARLARALEVELNAAEVNIAKSKAPNEIDSLDLSMRGWGILNRLFTTEGAREARSVFESSLGLDGGNIDALMGITVTYAMELLNYASPTVADHVNAGTAAISKALLLAPNNARAHLAHAYILRASRQPEMALRELDHAITLNSNLAEAHGQAAYSEIYLGRAENAEARVAAALRLSPRDPSIGVWYMAAGLADFYLARYEQAVDRLRKAIELSPGYGLVHYVLAATFAVLGREDEARRACASGRILHPEFSAGKFKRDVWSDHPGYLAQRERLYQGLRKAGVPEG